MGAIGLQYLPACGSACVDDGVVWKQEGNCEAVEASNSQTDSESNSNSESDSQPTDGSNSNSQTETDSNSGNSQSESNSQTDSNTNTESNSDSMTDTDPSSVSDTGGPMWCTDADMDGFGDPNDCHDEMLPGDVPNDDDCDDTDPTKGTDCGSGVCTPGDKRCNGDDLYTCNEQGDGETMETCEFGCDDDGLACWSALTVEAGPSLCVDMNMPAQLDAIAMGGDGNYSYLWSPAMGLSDPNIQNPTAMPVMPTSYTIDVMDGEGNMAADDVSIFLTDQPLVLDPDVCNVYDFPHENNPNNNDPVSLWEWDPQDEELCQTLNAKASALFCNWELDNATIVGRFSVNTANDDDWVGFMWGIQDTDHFYVFTWKQLGQFAGTCDGIDVGPGMQVKIINVADPDNAPMQCRDIHEEADTPNSTLLVSTQEFTTMGWQDNTDYIFRLTHLATGEMTIVVELAQNNQVVAMANFTDTTYANGQFGMYTKSQINACFSDFTVGCEQ